MVKKKTGSKKTEEQLVELTDQTKKQGVSTKKSAKKALTQKIYVGPNLPELQKYTVMENGYTPHVKEIVKKCPSIDKFFVAIKNMTETESRAKEKGTLEYRHFNKIVEYAAGKGE